MTETLLPCPECEGRGLGSVRIGNHRQTCSSCNRFAQAVIRRTGRAFRLAYPQQYDEVRSRVEREVYQDTIERGQP